MIKMYIGPHQAADLRANGRWDPETMTMDKEEAAAASRTRFYEAAVRCPSCRRRRCRSGRPTLLLRDPDRRSNSPPTQPEQPGRKFEEPKAENEALAAARAYAGAGYKVIPLKHRGKEPQGSWTGPAMTETEIASKFANGSANIGIEFGAPSRGLVDLDFNSPVAARIADELLGELPAYGRPGALRSHRFVVCKEALEAEGPCRHVTFTLPASIASHPRLQGPHGATILEVRANGCYSMVPPSTHPNGEGRGGWNPARTA